MYVEYIDYGNTDKVSRRDVMAFDPSLKEFPIILNKACLSGVQGLHPNAEWNEGYLMPFTPLNIRVKFDVCNLSHRGSLILIANRFSSSTQASNLRNKNASPPEIFQKKNLSIQPHFQPFRLEELKLENQRGQNI